MSDEPEYVSIHDRASDRVKKAFANMMGREVKEVKTVEVTPQTELEDIRKSLKYLLDRVTNMDRFIRSSQYRYGGRVMDGEAYEREVIEKFLINSRDGKLNDEYKQLCNKVLLGFKPKEIG